MVSTFIMQHALLTGPAGFDPRNNLLCNGVMWVVRGAMVFHTPCDEFGGDEQARFWCNSWQCACLCSWCSCQATHCTPTGIKHCIH